MEKETKNYVEPLNHDPKWLKKITIENDKFLIDREYINFFIIMYMQCSKETSSTSSSWELIIPRLPCHEKLAFSQFQLYIEAQTMTQFLCDVIAKRQFSFELPKAKKRFFGIAHMLRIHTGFRKWIKTNVLELHLKKE